MKRNNDIRVMVLFGFTLVLLFLGGCAYSQKVKDAAAEQVKLTNQLRSTAGAFKQAVDASLERSTNLATEMNQADEAFDLIEKGCFKQRAPADCPKKDRLGDHFERVSSGAFPQRDKLQNLVDTHFKVLSLQLQVMGRGAAIIQQYVDIDLTLGKGQINDLKEAVKGLAEAGGSQ